MKNCYYVFRDFFCLYFKIWNRLEVEGREHIPQSGGLIVVANHASYLDPPLLGVAMTRRMTYMAKESLFAAPLGVGRFVGSFSFPVNRGKTSHNVIKETVRRLCAGEAIAIFPGGQRAAEGDGTEEIRGGVELIARLSKAAILPAYLDGTGRSLPVGKKIPKPVKVRVRFGPPLIYKSDYHEKEIAPVVLDALRRLKN